jgi:hypothetical protein
VATPRLHLCPRRRNNKCIGHVVFVCDLILLHHGAMIINCRTENPARTFSIPHRMSENPARTFSIRHRMSGNPARTFSIRHSIFQNVGGVRGGHFRGPKGHFRGPKGHFRPPIRHFRVRRVFPRCHPGHFGEFTEKPKCPIGHFRGHTRHFRKPDPTETKETF